MALKPEASIMTALAVGAVVYGVYSNATPTIADIRSLERDNKDIQKAERAASWTSAGVVAAVSLIAKDPTIFILGGAMVVGIAWWHRHSDHVDTMSTTMRELSPLGKVGNTPSGVTQAGEMHQVAINYGAVI